MSNKISSEQEAAKYSQVRVQSPASLSQILRQAGSKVLAFRVRVKLRAAKGDKGDRVVY